MRKIPFPSSVPTLFIVWFDFADFDSLICAVVLKVLAQDSSEIESAGFSTLVIWDGPLLNNGIEVFVNCDILQMYHQHVPVRA